MPPVGFEPTISAGERPQAAHLLRSWVRIPPGAWIFVCCECSVLSGRGLCDELITRPEESYRLCCVVVCDLETSRIGAPYIYDISNLRVKIHTYHQGNMFQLQGAIIGRLYKNRSLSGLWCTIGIPFVYIIEVLLYTVF